MNNLKNKSSLFRDGNCLVFKSGDFEKRWNEFLYIPTPNFVCDILRETYEIASFEEYSVQELGKNSPTLSTFMNKENNLEHKANLVDKYLKNIYKLKYISFLKKHGISAKNFKKIFNYIMREIWEIKPYFSQFCYTYKHKTQGRKNIGFFCIDEHNVKILHKNIEILNEAKNNKENMIPFVFYSGMKISELEKHFPKSLWKKLCKNSFSRNRLISIRVKNDLSRLCCMEPRRSYVSLNKEKNYIDTSNPINVISYLNEFPSTILKQYFEINNATLALASCCKLKDFRKEYAYENGSLYKIIFDTITSLNRLNEKYNFDWSKEQWIRKHEEVTRLNTPF
jgi:hypothetical protein